MPANLVQKITGSVFDVVKRVMKNGNVHIRSNGAMKVAVGVVRKYLDHH